MARRKKVADDEQLDLIDGITIKIAPRDELVQIKMDSEADEDGNGD